MKSITYLAYNLNLHSCNFLYFMINDKFILYLAPKRNYEILFSQY